MRRIAILCLWVAVGAVLPLQAGSVEIAPHIGYRFGGELDDDENALFDVDVEIDESATVGATIGIPVWDELRIELLVSHQDTEFTEDDDLFSSPADLLDVELTYYHVGVSWTFDLRSVRPYVGGGLGITNIDPEGSSDDDEFSLNFGGGIKAMFAEHVGFRFDVRGFFTNVDDDHDCCWDDDYDDYDWDGDDDLWQGEVSAGLVISF